jgi:hypothetical protein
MIKRHKKCERYRKVASVMDKRRRDGVVRCNKHGKEAIEDVLATPKACSPREENSAYRALTDAVQNCHVIRGRVHGLAGTRRRRRRKSR